MTDFRPLLSRHVAARPHQGKAARELRYDQIRLVLRGTLGAGGLAPADSEVIDQMRQLEDAIMEHELAYESEESAPLNDLTDSAMPAPDEQMSGERRRFALNAISGGATNVVKILLQLLMLPVMAHLLGPAEFGLYALALPTVAFLTTLADGGLGASLAREQETSNVVWSTAFWTLLVTCSAMAAVAVAGGALMASIVGQPRLIGIMAVLSLNLPILALTSLPAARLIRRGNLVVHSVADLASAVIGTFVAVGLALIGAGAWALAVQYVTSGIISCIIFNLVAFKPPSFEFQFSSLKSHLVLGGTVIGSRLSELFGRQLESMLISRIYSPAFLGSFTFANQTSRFMCESAGNPVWGALFSHAVRASIADAEHLHERLSRLLALLLFPLAALASAAAPHIFNLVLGPHWASAAYILQIIIPSYAIHATASQCGALLLANGRGTLVFIIFAALSAMRVFCLLAIAVTGSMDIAWGVAAANLAFGVMMILAVGRTSESRLRRLVLDLVPVAVTSALAGVSCAVLLRMQPESLLWTVVSLGGGAVTFAVMISILQGQRLVADASALRRIILPSR